MAHYIGGTRKNEIASTTKEDRKAWGRAVSVLSTAKLSDRHKEVDDIAMKIGPVADWLAGQVADAGYWQSEIFDALPPSERANLSRSTIRRRLEELFGLVEGATGDSPVSVDLETEDGTPYRLTCAGRARKRMFVVGEVPESTLRDRENRSN